MSFIHHPVGFSAFCSFTLGLFLSCSHPQWHWHIVANVGAVSAVVAHQPTCTRLASSFNFEQIYGIPAQTSVTYKKSNGNGYSLDHILQSPGAASTVLAYSHKLNYSFGTAPLIASSATTESPTFSGLCLFS